MLPKKDLKEIQDLLRQYYSALDNQLYRMYDTGKDEDRCMDAISKLESAIEDFDPCMRCNTETNLDSGMCETCLKEDG